MHDPASYQMCYRIPMPRHLTIIGLGLLGGSIGLGVRKFISDCKIMGCAHRPDSLIHAQQLGAVDEWTLDIPQAVREADLVILCMPVGQIPIWIDKIGPHLKPGTVVTDVGSTKASICETGAKMSGPGVFVGSHPMAGGEKTGVACARADLFLGTTCVVTPTPSTDPSAVDRVEAFWTGLGMRVVRHDPKTHDRLVAWISHLPHAVAAAVVGVQTEASLDLRGKGWTDTTRIAAGDAKLWRDIFMENRENLIDAIGQLNAELSELVQLLRSGNANAVQDWLSRRAQRRTGL